MEPENHYRCKRGSLLCYKMCNPMCNQNWKSWQFDSFANKCSTFSYYITIGFLKYIEGGRWSMGAFSTLLHGRFLLSIMLWPLNLASLHVVVKLLLMTPYLFVSSQALSLSLSIFTRVFPFFFLSKSWQNVTTMPLRCATLVTSLITIIVIWSIQIFICLLNFPN